MLGAPLELSNPSLAKQATINLSYVPVRGNEAITHVREGFMQLHMLASEVGVGIPGSAEVIENVWMNADPVVTARLKRVRCGLVVADTILPSRTSETIPILRGIALGIREAELRRSLHGAQKTVIRRVRWLANNSYGNYQEYLHTVIEQASNEWFEY